MRYVIAMIAASLGAAFMMFFWSGGVADFVVARYRFDSSDSVADLHMATFMAANAAGLIAGWLVGWFIGGAVNRDEKAG